MTGQYSKRVDLGPGLELQTFQAQRDSSILSFMPIYWVARVRPLLRYPAGYITARLGFDLLGQEEDDTLGGRGYYGIGIGWISQSENPKRLQVELLYSRDRGEFPGIGLAVGYLY
jgi:hypothetical protein